MHKLTFATVVFVLFSASGVAAPRANQHMAMESAVVAVNPLKILGPMNRMVLGNNALGYLHKEAVYSAKGAGLWDPNLRAPVPGMVNLARAAGVSNIRWPGGCGVHTFNWKLTVGPLETRPKQPFGLGEFLQAAMAINADPVITIADYWGGENDAADLVEYLNAPVGRNPNGGIDWASVRAKQGHVEPYGVRWFEFGNETYHGNHASGTVTTGLRMGPKEYVVRFRSAVAAMKEVDPSIHIGAVLNDETVFPLSAWTEAVIKGTGDTADFFIYHAYLPIFGENDGVPPSEELFEIAFASAEQFSIFFTRLRGEIKRLTGRYIPLGVTEFNGHFVQEHPKPYRLTLGTAVLVSDMVLAFLKPDSGVALANYWQLSNEYWGMVRGYGAPYVKRPAYHVFQMLNEHLEDQIVEAQVASGGYRSKGGFGVLASENTPSKFEMKKSEVVTAPWKTGFVIGAKADVDDAGGLSVQLPSAFELNYYHSRICLPVISGIGYRVTAEIRSEGLAKSGAQLEVIDDRGWNATKSSSLSDLVRSSTWLPVTVDYVALPDSKGIEIRLRRLGGVAEGGRMEVRNVRIQRFVPDRVGTVPYVSAVATKGSNKFSVFLVNRNVSAPVQVKLEGMPAGTDTAWTLSGPAVDSDNEKNPDEVVPKPIPVARQAGGLVVTIPAHSFSVISTALSQR